MIRNLQKRNGCFIKMFVYILNDSFDEEGNIEHFLDNLIC